MKALVYDGPRDVVVKDVPDAKIEHPTDVLVKITTTNICGSDLHMYEGRTDLEQGMVLGHENMGIVAEVGNAVPNAPDKLEQEGRIAFDMGKFWFKGQRVGTGQAIVKHYNRQLRDLIHEGRAKPSW